MKETYTVSDFRAHIYTLVDQVIRSGRPLILARGEKRLEVRLKPKKPARTKRKLHSLADIRPIDALTEDAETYRNIRWDTWRPSV